MISAQEAYKETNSERLVIDTTMECLDTFVKQAIKYGEYSINVGNDVSSQVLAELKKLGYRTEWTSDKELVISWDKTNADKDFENAFNGSSSSLPFEDNGDYDERFEYISKALDNDMLFYEQFKDKIKSGIHDIFETQDEKYLDIADMVNIILEYFEEV